MGFKMTGKADDKSQNEAMGRKDDAKTGKLKNHNNSLQDSEGK
jgi:hypothetical protein